jgi:hypothetical protein
MSMGGTRRPVLEDAGGGGGIQPESNRGLVVDQAMDDGEEVCK